MEEEDVVVNCTALFYKEGTEGETSRKKNKFRRYSGPPCTCGFGIREKIRCGLRFFGVFLCGFAVFGPPYAPSFIVHFTCIHTLPRVPRPSPKILLLDTRVQSMKFHK